MVKAIGKDQEHTVECSTSPTCCKHVFKQSCEGRGSDTSKGLAYTNSDVDQLSGKRDQDLRVPVLNMRGEPLMPTSPAKARHLLEQDKARVVTRKPFTIQLKYASGETKQPITLGIDAGYKTIGFSAVTDNAELLSGELKLRTDIPKKLEQRRNYRRTRRSRLWHRKPRFLNRSKPDGWLTPSIQHKLDTHIRLVNTIKKLLPITETVVEVASFDIQKMMNPEISGIEYQQGILHGYNIRQYLLEKWGHKCAYCKKKNIPLEVEHMIPRARGGSNRIPNLTIACHECNQKKGTLTVAEFGFPNLQKKADKTYRDATFMNIVRWKLVNHLNCKHTYGHITKYNRTKLGLPKSHANDAFAIAGGTKDMQHSTTTTSKQFRRNNRSLQKNRKGFKHSIRRQHYSLQPNDLVKYNGKEHRVKGMHCLGTRVMLDIKKSIALSKVELITYGKGIFN